MFSMYDSQRRQWHPTPVLLPGKSHGRGSLVGYIVHGVAMSRTWLSDFTFTFHFHALEKEMATHSSILAWRIPGMAEPGGLQSMGSHRVGHDWSDFAPCMTVQTHSRHSWIRKGLFLQTQLSMQNFSLVFWPLMSWYLIKLWIFRHNVNKLFIRAETSSVRNTIWHRVGV